jgi:hypothetical protein
MTDPLLCAEDRARLREFAVTQALARPHLLPSGTRIADWLRQLLPALDDETIAAGTACAAHVTMHHAEAADCPHVHAAALLLQAAAVDLAHLELDPPGQP